MLGHMLGHPLMALGGAATLLWCAGNSAVLLRSPVLLYWGKAAYGWHACPMPGIRIGVAVLGGITSHFSAVIAFWLCALIATMVPDSIPTSLSKGRSSVSSLAAPACNLVPPGAQGGLHRIRSRSLTEGLFHDLGFGLVGCCLLILERLLGALIRGRGRNFGSHRRGFWSFR